MINRIKNILNRRREKEKLHQIKKLRKDGLKLNTIVYVVKYGEEIGLKVENRDAYGGDVRRRLELDGVL